MYRWIKNLFLHIRYLNYDKHRWVYNKSRAGEFFVGDFIFGGAGGTFRILKIKDNFLIVIKVK